MISYFLGANAPGGFYSLYDGLIDLNQAKAVYILKGGPGCGKSTLMKELAHRAEAAGQPVEYILCSGDPNSLDAILLPRLGVAVVDGTAPHVVEPKYSGVVEQYLNLGDCYRTSGLTPHREEIVRLLAANSACYPRAYRCLSAAADIGFDCRSILLTKELETALARRAKGIVTRQLHQKGSGTGTVQTRFLSAITCQGKLCQWETVQAQCRQVVELEDSYGFASLLLTPLVTAATAAGHDVVACPDPMAPDRLAHLLLPGLGLAFVTPDPELPYTGKSHRRIRIDAMVDSDLLRRSRPRLRFARKVAAALTEEAVASLAQAKGIHDELESVYNPHVDFGQVHAMAAILGDKLGL